MNLDNIRIPCVIMRAGTSKGVFLLGNDLPSDLEKRNKVILSIFGSPDTRQIDGLGGADPLTSKLAIIEPSDREDADINYTFGQVDINSSFIDYSSNCGNISSGVGPFAIAQGLIKAREPYTTVCVYNTNTDKVFTADVPVKDGKPQVSGDFKVPGVPGTGAKILINLAGTVGSKTGKLLPTGNVQDVLDVIGFGNLTVSMVDAGSPMVFLKAEDIGLTGIETPSEIDRNPEMLKLLEQIRAQAAERMGIVKNWRDAVERVRAVPLVAFVAPPKSYKHYSTGEEIHSKDMDFVSRVMFMQVMHKTYSGTASVCTGCAAVIPGTIVNQVMERHENGNEIRFGHPAGIMGVQMETEGTGFPPKITRAAIGRTARRIMEGYVYVPAKLLD